jgi:MFS family permease
MSGAGDGSADGRRVAHGASGVSAWSPFRHPAFRALWTAQLASNIGSFMQTVGAAWLMVELQASPVAIALVQTAIFLPVVLVGVAAGALADLLDRRRLLLVTQSLMLAAAGALAVLTALDLTTQWSLLALTFALGLGSAFNAPAWQAIQPDLVPASEFRQAVTLGSASINLGRAVGPAVGGLLIAAVGAWLVFFLNAVSFAAVVIVLWRWRRAVEDESGPAERFAGAVRAGVRYALYSTVLHGVLVRTAAFAVASAGFMALLPVYASRVLGVGSGWLGMLYAGFGVGGVITAAIIPRLRRHLNVDRLFALGTLLVAVCMLALAVVGSPWPALVLTLPGGAGWLLCLSTLNVASQEVLPGWVRARGLALYLTALSAGIAAGSYAWGSLAGAYGVQVSFAWAAAALAASLLLALRWRFAAIARLDLSPAPMPSPESRLPVEDSGSPVLVVVSYEVRPEAEAQFLQSANRLRRMRRRTGAVSWSIYEDAEEPHRYIETFVLPTWDEHVRQHDRRTVADAGIQEEIEQCLRDGTAPQARHYVAPPQPSLFGRLR